MREGWERRDERVSFRHFKEVRARLCVELIGIEWLPSFRLAGASDGIPGSYPTEAAAQLAAEEWLAGYAKREAALWTGVVESLRLAALDGRDVE